MKNWWIYVLKLEHGKYYVGITSQKDPNRRIKQHGIFGGAAWTELHKPVETLELTNLGEMTYEEAVKIESVKTREYIKTFGLNNVRGGDLTVTQDYVYRFGRFITINDWQSISVITFLLIVIAYLMVRYVL